MNHRHHIAATLATLLVAWATPASAQQARVDINLDRSLAYVGEEVRVEVTIQINGNFGYERYLPPSFEGFRVLGSGGSSTSIVAGTTGVRRTESVIYSVMPLKAGSLKVGPAAVMIGGKMVRSAPAKLQVKKGSGQPAPVPGVPDPGAQPGDPGAPPPPASDDPTRGKGLSILAEAQPARVYQGQALVATWTLYAGGNMGRLNFAFKAHPSTDGFWSEEFNTPKRLQWEQKVLGGNIYNVALLVRRKLYPQKAGTLELGSLKADVTTMQFFNSRRHELASEPAPVEVLPLPEEGKPAGFAPGNVGRFDLSASLDRDKVKGGDAVTLTMVIRGEGNLRQLTVPPLAELPGFKVYEPKVTDNLEVGEKKLEYLLMPIRAGRLSVPAIPVPTFDPGLGQYRVLTTRSMTLQVTGPMPQAMEERKDPTKNVLGPTIRPPRAAGELAHQAPFRPLASTLLWGVFLLPLVLLGLVSGADRLRASLRQETPRRLQRAASRRIREHLKRARELSRGGDKAGFYGEVSAALRDLLDHKLAAKVEGMTRPELGKLLDARGFAPELAAEVIEQLESCDFARFTPSASDASEMDRTLAGARKLLDRINRVKLRGAGEGA